VGPIFSQERGDGGEMGGRMQRSISQFEKCDQIGPYNFENIPNWSLGQLTVS
jgi:hypothetical protein